MRRSHRCRRVLRVAGRRRRSRPSPRKPSRSRPSLTWQQEFGDDPHEALRKISPDDQRYPEVVAWANAKDQATLNAFPKEPPVEAAPEVPAEDPAIAQITGALSSMGIRTPDWQSAVDSIGRRLGVPNLGRGNPADIVAFLRENGVAVPEPAQRKSVAPPVEAPAELRTGSVLHDRDAAAGCRCACSAAASS